MAFKNNLLFDYLKNIVSLKSIELCNKHASSAEFSSSFSSFMVIRYLSMHPDEDIRKIVLENQIELERLGLFPATLYRFLLEKIPQKRSSFIKYIK